MGAYALTPLAGAFDAVDIQTNFADLRTAINALDSTNNFAAGKLTHRVVRPNAVTQTWKSEASDLNGFAVVLNNTLGLGGVLQNLYHVPGTGVRFYLHSDAELVRFYGWVELRKSKADWLLAAETYAPQIVARIISEFALLSTFSRYSWTEVAPGGGNNEKRGVLVQVAHSVLNVSKGWHDAYLLLETSNSATNHATNDRLAQFYGTSRGMVVQAHYGT